MLNANTAALALLLQTGVLMLMLSICKPYLFVGHLL
jgi:hypothetical protein